MVGDILDANGNERAFKWVDGPTSLPSLSGTRSGAEDINDAGVVVGWYDSGGTLYRRVVHSNGDPYADEVRSYS